MGDIANMTDCDGRVHGPRLLRWLCSRSQMEHELACDAQSRGQIDLVLVHMHMAVEFRCMADDLAAELTPPDYPDGDGKEPERLCPNCKGRGEVADHIGPRGPVTVSCQACSGTGWDCTVDEDAVDMDDPAFLGRHEQE